MFPHSVKRPAPQGHESGFDPRPVLGTLATVGLIAALGFNVRAAPDGVTSNLRVALNDTTFITETNEFVTVLGLLHVQTKALADGTVDLQANLTDQVLAYPAEVQNPTTERRQRLLALRLQVVELVNQIEALQAEIGELREALDDELNPFVRRRLEELIARAERRLLELSRELDKVLAAMRALLEEIDEEEGREPGPLYSLAGVQRSRITCAPVISCSAFLVYPLAHALQGSASLAIRLDLTFSSRGVLISSAADIGAE